MPRKSPESPSAPSSQIPAKKEMKTIPLRELIDRERLDVKKIIKKGLTEIPEGHTIYDDDFRLSLGVSSGKWREASRDEEFARYKAMLPNKRIVWGKPSTIAEAKKFDGVTDTR